MERNSIDWGVGVLLLAAFIFGVLCGGLVDWMQCSTSHQISVEDIVRVCDDNNVLNINGCGG